MTLSRIYIVNSTKIRAQSTYVFETVFLQKHYSMMGDIKYVGPYIKNACDNPTIIMTLSYPGK